MLIVPGDERDERNGEREGPGEGTGLGPAMPEADNRRRSMKEKSPGLLEVYLRGHTDSQKTLILIRLRSHF